MAVGSIVFMIFAVFLICSRQHDVGY